MWRADAWKKNATCLLSACCLHVTTEDVVQLAYVSCCEGFSGSLAPGPHALSLNMGLALIPARRIRGKTNPGVKVSSRQPLRRKRSKPQSLRKQAVKDGLAPKARKSFVIFFQEHSTVKKGASKVQFQNEMKHLGQVWRSMSAEQQRPYKDRSTDEFQEQRSALLVRGIKVRSAHGIMKPGCNVERGLPADPETSERVGPYVIDVANPSLGGGTYGSVLRCQHPQSGCSVAVKVYRGLDGQADCHHEVAQMKLLLRVVPQQKQIWFPRLVNSAVTGKPWPWMAAEFCGPSLASVLRQPDLHGKPKTWSVAAQLRSALHALHNGGILHLDVKPGNVLWCPFTDQLKMCDFGMSEMVARLAKPGASPRFLQYVTAAYRPPELWPVLLKKDSDSGISKKLLTTAVDVWSYTCVVYEVETGQHFMPKGESALRTWCEHWPELWRRQRNLRKCAPKYHSSCTMLLRAGNWASFVLSGCAPEADKRGWPELCPK